MLKLPSAERFNTGLRPNTIQVYRRVLQKAFDAIGEVMEHKIDQQLTSYVEMAPVHTRRSLAEKLICAAKHFFPHLSLQLLGVTRYLKLLKKQIPSATKPPMVEEVLISVVAQLILMGFPTTALAAYLQFDLYLRPAELTAIQAHHLLLPGGDILGKFTGRIILVLPHTKTGPLQSVDVRLPLLHKLLLRLLASSTSTELLFPPYRVYSQRLASALEILHLTSIGYTPHSIRHGAATTDLFKGGYSALSAILYRGRWESSAGKHYLQMGAALLLSAKLPHNFISRATHVKEYLEGMFNGTSLRPRV